MEAGQRAGGLAKLTPRSFRSPALFRAWLAKNHATAKELILRCSKTAAAPPGVSYRQALDEALCFGWIDGVRRALDAGSFSVRFSPRKRKSAWSKVNRKRARELEKEGRMRPPGRAAFEKRIPSAYSFEWRPVTLAPADQRRLRRDPKAWAFWQAQAPWYRRTCSFFVMSAKKKETRARRFQKLLDFCARGLAIPPLARAKK